MRSKITILLFFIFISSNIEAQKKEVSYPLCDQENKLLRINKLKIDKKETVLECIVHSVNSATIIALVSSSDYLQGKSGKKYMLTGCEGMELNKALNSLKVIPIILRFEPMDINEKSFDFVSNNLPINNILTYKPETVKPFECKIKGRLVGIPDCVSVRITPTEDQFTYILTDTADVKNGEFEFKRLYNFEEKYYLYFDSAPDKYNHKKLLVTCTIYVGPGEIDLTIYPDIEERKGLIRTGKRIINGGKANKESLKFEEFTKKLFTDNIAVYRKINELSKIDNNNMYFGHNLEPYFDDGIISDRAKNELKVLYQLEKEISRNNRFGFDSKNKVATDSIDIKTYQIINSTYFYTEEAHPLIREREKTDSIIRGEIMQYLSENVSAPTLYQIYSQIANLTSERNYPLVSNYSYYKYNDIESLSTHNSYKILNADNELANKLIAEYALLFKTKYQPVLGEHPYAKKIMQALSYHTESMKTIDNFTKACEEIDLTINPATELDEDIPMEYSQMKDDIQKAVNNKDEEGIKIIRKFSEEYALKYPNMQLTNDIKKIISVAISKDNPNRWHIERPIIVTGMQEAIEYLLNKQSKKTQTPSNKMRVKEL